MDFKFDQLFDKIVTQSKIVKEDVQLTEEQAKANFEAIVEKVKAAFDEYGVDCDEYEDQDEDGVTYTAEWRWENKNGVDDYLGLSYCNGKAEFEDNGGMGDLDLTDVEGTAKGLIDEYLFNPEYGGIGCEVNLEEVVPELLQQMSEDDDYSDLDWDNMDLDELADEFIDEYCEYEFETEDEIKDQLQEWLSARFGDDEDEDEDQ